MSYILEVALFQAIAVIAYRLLCYNVQKTGWNRLILLSIVVLSFIAPKLNLAAPSIFQNAVATETWIADGISEISVLRRISDNAPIAHVNGSWMLTCYLSIAGILLCKYFLQLITLLKKHKNHKELKKMDGVYSTPYPFAFSFFHRIHIPAHLWEQDSMKTIILHEKQHASLGHSWDRLLMELVTVLFWFNPFTYLIRKYLIEVHEFEADQKTIEITQMPLEYQWLLLDQSQVAHRMDLINYFALSNTKRRLQMINSKTNKQWKYAIVVPVICTLLGIFGFEQKTRQVMPWFHLNTVMLQPAYQYESWLTEKIQQQVPSILPLKINEEQIKITSEWGQRRDPFTKEMRHHYGIDLKATRGTSVIATASGTIAKVGYQPNGYGHFVIIRHADGYKTRYAQMEDVVGEEGDQVPQGQVIGHVGSSGRSTAPHLHYEVYKNDKRVNPAQYISDFKAE